MPKVLTRADPQHHEHGNTAAVSRAVRKLQRSIGASGTFTFPSAKALSYNYTPDWKRASQCFCITGMTLRRGARWLSSQQDWRVIVAVERDVCSLTVDLRARPLSSGMLVGGADGVSDCRQRLKQREWSRQRCSDKDALNRRWEQLLTRQVAQVLNYVSWFLQVLDTIVTFISRKVLKQNWASFLRCGSASLLCVPRLVRAVCSLQGSFHSLQCNSVAAVRGSTAQWSFKKPLAPPFWLTHWRDTDSSGNHSAAGNWRKRWRERSISYCDIIGTVCAIKLVQRRWINKGLVLIFYFLQLKQTCHQLLFPLLWPWVWL